MLHAHIRRGTWAGLALLLMVPAARPCRGSSSPVGTLRSQGAVYLGGDATAAAAVYSGDRIRTEEGCATISVIPGNLVLIGRQSSAQINQTPTGLTLGLDEGSLSWSVAAGSALHVEAGGVTLSSSGSFRTLAEVATRSDGSLSLAVHRGSVSVADLRAEPVAVSAGQRITISPRLAQAEKSRPVGTGAHAKMTLGEKLRTFQIGNLSHGASAAIVVGALGGATATAIAVPLTVGQEASPYVP